MSTSDGRAFGLDVSHHQDSPSDWSPDGLEFLFARASIGTLTDDTYDSHIAKARQAGLITGAYHFNHSPISVASQVKVFLAKAGDVDFFVLDVEPDLKSGVPAFSRAQTREFIDRVQQTGRKIVLYMSKSVFFDAGQDYDWVAYWLSTPPPIHWDFWQFGGYQGVDANIFHGTPAQLRALLPAVQEALMPGLSLRILEPLAGTVTVVGSGHALITVDTAAFVPIPAGQVREVVARAVLTAAVPGHESIAAGNEGYVVGNIPNLTPDTSALALLLAGDGGFDRTPALDCSTEVKLATDPLNAKIAALTGDVDKALNTGFETARTVAGKLIAEMSPPTINS